jgi:hypothetical protein
MVRGSSFSISSGPKGSSTGATEAGAGPGVITGGGGFNSHTPMLDRYTTSIYNCLQM